jgi:hypothetical protein
MDSTTKESAVATRPRVLVIDDGELKRFVDAFRELDVELERLRGDVCDDDLAGPYDVVVSTVKRVLTFEGTVDLGSLPGKPVWIAVHGQDFLPLRVRLLRMGVHFLVQSSVGREALRLLVLHVLHAGPERRGELRLPVGSPVVCRDSANASFEVVLLDLGSAGCRLLSEHAPEPGASLTVELPSKLAGGAELSLAGHVGRVGDHPSGKRLVSVEFSDLPPEAEELLQSILSGKVIGTVVTRLGDEFAADPASLSVPNVSASPAQQAPTASSPKPPAAASGAAAPSTRNNRRIRYDKEVTALLESGEDIVLGRDLSVEGMCAEPRPDLPVGLTLELAIYGPQSGAEPVLVRARVDRNDPRHGTVFRFTEIVGEDRARLEAMIKAGAEILSLAPGHGEGEAIVVSAVQPASKRR